METPLSRNVRILPDPEAAARTAARTFLSAAAVAISLRGRFSVALSGGSTPQQLYHMLGSSYREIIRWELTHLFWSDERCVAKDHVQSNFRLAYDAMISRIGIPNENIHRIQGELAPGEAAAAYEAELNRHFGADALPRFDLVLLGIGEDGHTASLFPESETLSETKRLAVPAFSPSAGDWRVTLTLPVLNNTALVVFLVTGRTKAGIMTEILVNDTKDAYPAGLVSPHHGRLIWLLDEDAASGLRHQGP
jgi:6-phosphogluconolactonase